MPLYKKTSPQTVNNSATLVDLTWDDTLPTLTEGVYHFEAFFFFTSAATPDIKFTLAKGTGLSDATAEWEKMAVSTAGSSAFGVEKVFAGSGSLSSAGIAGIIIVGSDPGTVKVQFAQNTANASDTIVEVAAFRIYAADAIATIGKAADETRTATATLADDGALVADALASSFYLVEFLLPLNSGTVADFKMALDRTGLSDATFYWGDFTDFGIPQGGLTFGSVAASATGSSGSNQIWGGAGILVTGTDPGSLKLQWAQNTSDAGNTTVLAGAVLSLDKAA